MLAKTLEIAKKKKNNNKNQCKNRWVFAKIFHSNNKKGFFLIIDLCALLKTK